MLQRALRFRGTCHRRLRFCTSSKASDPGDTDTTDDVQLPEAPTNCCMSGCANCVWLEYAKELTKIYHDGGARAQKLILERISDPTLKVFLQMELRTLAKDKTST